MANQHNAKIVYYTNVMLMKLSVCCHELHMAIQIAKLLTFKMSELEN